MAGMSKMKNSPKKESIRPLPIEFISQRTYMIICIFQTLNKHTICWSCMSELDQDFVSSRVLHLFVLCSMSTSLTSMPLWLALEWLPTPWFERHPKMIVADFDAIMNLCVFCGGPSSHCLWFRHYV